MLSHVLTTSTTYVPPYLTLPDGSPNYGNGWASNGGGHYQYYPQFGGGWYESSGNSYNSWNSYGKRKRSSEPANDTDTTVGIGKRAVAGNITI